MRTASLTIALACLSGVALLAAPAPAPKPRAGQVFVAVLEGGYEVPPVDTHATGTAELSWTGTALRYQVHVDSISDITGAYLHVGRAGADAPAVADLFDGVKAGPVSGLLVRGTLTTGQLHETTMARLLRALRDDGAYVTVHTMTHRGGELRGQLRGQPIVASR